VDLTWAVAAHSAVTQSNVEVVSIFLVLWIVINGGTIKAGPITLRFRKWRKRNKRR
jgi:hypothetical protein